MMFDDQPPDLSDRLESLAQEFSQLAPDDQEQVLALVAYLRSNSPTSPEQRDVPFMDFDD